MALIDLTDPESLLEAVEIEELSRYDHESPYRPVRLHNLDVFEAQFEYGRRL